MKPVQSTLRRWMQDNENFKENYIKIRKEVLADSEIKAFLAEHPGLPQKEITKSLIKLYEYQSQSKQCASCASFGACQNMLPGYSPVLDVENGEIRISYEKCHNRILHEKVQAQEKLIQSVHMPRDILQATTDDIDYRDAKRNPAIRELAAFIKEVENGLPAKGIYFYGSFGVGKTYFLGAIANKLKELNISSMMIYMPEFVREIKSSFKDDSTNEKVDYFKRADVLMLDDIGAEMQSAWFRDEILGSILQYRMMEGLPVFFTSNYSLDQLEGLLASTRSGIETVKAGRIVERIRQVSNAVEIIGDNRRYL